MSITKQFRKGSKIISFQFEKDVTDPNPASELTFEDEEPVRELCWYPYIEKNMTVLNVGAGFGSYCLPAAAIGAKVHSFCPEHEYPLLKNSIAANPPEFQRRISLYPYGLYDREGYWKTDTMKFVPMNEIEDEGQKLIASNVGPCGWYIKVTTLDRWANSVRLNRLDIMNLDVEGAEAHVLQGATQTIRRFHPKILVECHIFKDGGIEYAVHNLLSGFGYKRIERMEMSSMVHHCFYIYEKRF